MVLSALVTHRGSNDEGAGFYKLAAELKKMPTKPTADQKLEAFVRLTREVRPKIRTCLKSAVMTQAQREIKVFLSIPEASRKIS
jgi:hypothetical protein